MGFLSASASFTRYRIIEEVPDQILRDAPDLLTRGGFKEIENSAEAQGFGWVAFNELLDSEWRTAPPEKGAYLAFGLRLDTRRVSPAVFKKHFAIALAEAEREAKDAGRKFLSRERKKELREQVNLKLMARTLPIPALFDVVWNLDTHTVYFASTQNKMCELFQNLFTATFDLHLEPLTPYYLALSTLGQEAQSDLDEVEATVFV